MRFWADCKRQVRPHVPQYVRAFVQEVASHRRQPEGDIATQLVMSALNDLDTISRLAPYLLHGYTRGHRLWVGHPDHEDLKAFVRPTGAVMGRLHMRLSHDEWSSLNAFAFAFGVEIATIAAALLRVAHDYPQIVQRISS